MTMPEFSEALNPFAGYGTIVSGDRLVGREAVVARLERVVGEGLGSAALVGVSRIGKSSIAREVLDRSMELPEVSGVWFDMGSLLPDRDLFGVLRNELQQLDELADAFSGEAPGDPFAAFVALRRACQRHARSGRRLVIVLDEFDAIRLTPSADPSVRRLRELIYQPRSYGVCVLVTTRRPLNWIERAIPNLSSLDGVCPSTFVKPLDAKGVASLVERAGPQAPPDAAAFLEEQFGGHPYLLEAVLHEVCDGSSLWEAVETQRDALDVYYRDLLDMLAEDKLYTTMVDPARETSPQREIAMLRQFGLLRMERPEPWGADFGSFIRSRNEVSVRAPFAGRTR